MIAIHSSLAPLPPLTSQRPQATAPAHPLRHRPRLLAVMVANGGAAGAGAGAAKGAAAATGTAAGTAVGAGLSGLLNACPVAWRGGVTSCSHQRAVWCVHPERQALTAAIPCPLTPACPLLSFVQTQVACRAGGRVCGLHMGQQWSRGSRERSKPCPKPSWPCQVWSGKVWRCCGSERGRRARAPRLRRQLLLHPRTLCVVIAALHIKHARAASVCPYVVDVKVDFLRPTIETIQQSFQSAWAQLPPPVQQVGICFVRQGARCMCDVTGITKHCRGPPTKLGASSSCCCCW